MFSNHKVRINACLPYPISNIHCRLSKSMTSDHRYIVVWTRASCADSIRYTIRRYILMFRSPTSNSTRFIASYWRLSVCLLENSQTSLCCKQFIWTRDRFEDPKIASKSGRKLVFWKAHESPNLFLARCSRIWLVAASFTAWKSRWEYRPLHVAQAHY